MPKYNVTLCNMKFREKDYTSQYGNFKIFLSFGFYVKSILENLEGLELPFLQF